MSKRCCAKTCFNSSQTNKNISFFGFPKNEFYAHAWAKAADREDLIGKPLNCLNKYNLCSEHFTDGCFADPPHNTKLKKVLRPVNVPIPSIFRNNLFQFTPGIGMKRKNSSEYVIPEKYHDAEEPEYITDEKDMQSLQADTLSEVDLICESDEDDQKAENVCRLCAYEYGPAVELNAIFEDEKLENAINRLLPNVVQKDDGLPQSVCRKCIDKMDQCLNSIDNFQLAQDLLKSGATLVG